MFNLSEIQSKPIEVRFSLAQTSIDGGLFLLKEVEIQIGIIGRLASCIIDPRHQGHVQHDIKSLFSQQIIQIAAGYEDEFHCFTQIKTNLFCPHILM